MKQTSSCAYLNTLLLNYWSSQTSKVPLDTFDSHCPFKSVPRLEGTFRHKVSFVRRFSTWTRIMSSLSLVRFIAIFGTLRSRNFPTWILKASRCSISTLWTVSIEVIWLAIGVFIFIFMRFSTLIVGSSFCWEVRPISSPCCAGTVWVLHKFCFPIVWGSLNCFCPHQKDT